MTKAKYECTRCGNISTIYNTGLTSLRCSTCGFTKLIPSKVRSSLIKLSKEDAEKIERENREEQEEARLNGEEMATCPADPFHVPDNQLPPMRNFICINCAKEFEYDTSRGTASCIHCSSVDVKLCPPKAVVLGTLSPRIMSKAERKRYRVIVNGYKNIKSIEQSAAALCNAMVRAGVRPKLTEVFNKLIAAVSKELTRTYEKKIKSYDKTIKEEQN